MGFYDLSKEARVVLVNEMTNTILNDFKTNSIKKILEYFEDEDTYIRKTAYQAVGKIYFAEKQLQASVLNGLKKLFTSADDKVRQTVINAAGEIGIVYFEIVQAFFDKGLEDEHHRVRNAVIGSIKKMADKNPKPVLVWCKKYVAHPDKEIRRQICHGIELRGRTHPKDILPLLKAFEFDETTRVKNTLIHVLGQIAYKKGCLPKVITHLKT
ncbi:HEAT repeat domain-containing protein [Mesonia sp. K7]|uniref:HEAT repeat domain-containing protein n=1 Tax=Mesonia sp. K7 TaxID=2218606 RepID=UPI0018F264B1|nr:HEAT repeat domain-containing protein [Mesonia sp. K7]